MIKVKVCVAAEKVPDTISWLIMRFLNYHGSHIFLVFRGQMFHCDDAGIVEEEFSKFCKTHHIVEEVELDAPCTVAEFYEWFEGYRGTPYSYSQFWGFAIPSWSNLFQNGRQKAICSEFVCWFLKDIMKDKRFENGEFASPKAIIDMIKAAPNG